MPLRRPHSKSRLGCIPCKKRHIKCGEETPTCQNCNFRQVSCVYGPTATATPRSASKAPSSEDVSSPHKTTYERSSQPPTPQAQNLATREVELKLLLHFMTRTSQTLAQDSRDLHIWTEIIPEEAMNHSFVMDGLLSAASLHFAHQNAHLRFQYTEQAIHYQNSGLQKYNDALGNINEQNCTGLFAYSIMLNMMAIALPNAEPNSPPSAHTASIMTMIDLVRGISLVHSTAITLLQHNKFEPLFRPPPIGPRPDRETEVAMESLRKRADGLLASESIDIKRHAAYHTGISSLENVFAATTIDSRFGRIVAWPALLWPDEPREELMRLFKHGDVMAQVIFMHYGVLLLNIRHHWWAQSTGVSLIEHLSTCVRAAGPTWASEADWPREVAQRILEADQAVGHSYSSFQENAG